MRMRIIKTKGKGKIENLSLCKQKTRFAEQRSKQSFLYFITNSLACNAIGKNIFSI